MIAQADQAQARAISTPSWAALVFAPIYFLFMRAWVPGLILSVVLFVPFANLLAWGYYGIVGKRIAWRARRWRSFEDFLACQRAWDRAAKAVAAFLLLATIAAFYGGGRSAVRLRRPDSQFCSSHPVAVSQFIPRSLRGPVREFFNSSEKQL